MKSSTSEENPYWDLWKKLFHEHLRTQVVELTQSARGEPQGLEMDMANLDHVFPDLYEEILNNPVEAFQVANDAIASLQPEFRGVPPDCFDISFRVINSLPECLVPIRKLSHRHIGKFISLEGMITRVTEVRPKYTDAVFECDRCGEPQTVKQNSDDLELKSPLVCDLCDRDKTTKFTPNDLKSTFIDLQRVEIQESLEGLKGGAQPERLEARAMADLCLRVYSGERVILNGILKTRTKKIARTESTVKDLFLDINSIEKLEIELDVGDISAEELDQIQELSKEPDLLQQIVQSVAPSIHGFEMEKIAVALQMFGGVRKVKRNRVPRRGDIHILLVGDPGTAKSQLLREVCRMVPRSAYASGQTSSKAGLTAAATKDALLDGRFVLEAGVLPLADMGHVSVDEMDKMDKDDRSSMLEALEQQTVTISKAGLRATLQCRCSLLAAANPKGGNFDAYLPFFEQVDLPPELLSRFDAIFYLDDTPNREDDMKFAKWLLAEHDAAARSMRNPDEEEEDDAPINRELLRKYIAYAKRYVIPVQSPAATDLLVNYWAGLRPLSPSGATKITGRQLEGLLRMSEASAKMRLAEEITAEDAQLAIDILEHWVSKVAIDPATGEIDVGRVTGVNSRDLSAMLRIEIRTLVRSLAAEHPDGVPIMTIIEEIQTSHDLPEKQIRTLLDVMARENELAKRGRDLWALA